MWQSQLETSIISLRILTAPMRSKCCSIEISIKGGAHMRSIDASIPDKSLYCLSAPPLTEVLCYSASNAVVQSKYATKIMFDFYT